MSWSGESIPESLIVDSYDEMERNSHSWYTGTIRENTPLLKLKNLSTSVAKNNAFYESGITNSLTSTFYSRSYSDNTSSTCSSSICAYIGQYRSPKQLANGNISSVTTTSYTSRSLALHSSMITTFGEETCAMRNSTVLSTILNILPLLQGTPILALPFAFVIAGIGFIPMAILLCSLANVSSKLLVECLYTYSPRREVKHRVYNGIHSIANACFGRFWGNTMYSFVIFHLILNNIINTIIFDSCFRNLFDTRVPEDSVIRSIIYSVIFASILYVKKLSVYVITGFIAIVSLVVASITAFSTFLEHTSSWPTISHSIPIIDVQQFPIAIGIFMHTLLANPIIPEIEAGMINPNRIDMALNVSYGTSSIFKILFGLFGALSYGLYTEELVALNIIQHSHVARYFIIISLLLCTFGNYVLPYHVLFEKFDQFLEYTLSYNFGEDGRFHFIWFILSRTVGVFLTVLIALNIPYYAAVVATTGSITGTALTLIFPVLYHLKLFWEELNNRTKIWEILLMVIGVLLGGASIYFSLLNLVDKIFT